MWPDSRMRKYCSVLNTEELGLLLLKVDTALIPSYRLPNCKTLDERIKKNCDARIEGKNSGRKTVSIPQVSSFLNQILRLRS